MGLRPGSTRRMFDTTEPPPGPGDVITVGPAVPATPAYTRDGIPRPAKPDELDGFEGPGVIEAVEGSYARVRLLNGRVAVGIKRSRLTKGEGDHESQDKRDPPPKAP